MCENKERSSSTMEGHKDNKVDHERMKFGQKQQTNATGHDQSLDLDEDYDDNDEVQQKMQRLIDKNFIRRDQDKISSSTSSSSSLPIPTSVSVGGNRAMQILLNKFSVAVESLDSMDPVKHTASVGQYAEVIQKLADAIAAVKNIA